MKQSPLRRRTPLRSRSNSDSARERDDALRAAQDEARRLWGDRCIVPGCTHSGWPQRHHAKTRGAHAELRAEAHNLFPLCRPHHREARRGAWLGDALIEASEVGSAAAAGRRPYMDKAEVQGIIIRHMRAAEEGTRHGSTG